MEYIVEGRSRSAKWVEALLPSMINQLKLDRSKKFLQVIFDTTPETHGSSLDLTDVTGCYLVVISPHRDLNKVGLTLAHEMIHIKQLATGLLKYAPNSTMLWRGVEYGDDVPYLDRPWEIQAFSGQELLYRRAVEV